MLIECTLKRDAPIEVPIGNEIYNFELDEEGRRVAEVYRQDHIDCFLACPALYRPLDGQEAEPPAPSAPQHDRKEIIARLKAAGIKFKVTASTAALAALLPAETKAA